MALAIIFLPKAFGQRGAYVFHYQVPRPVIKGKREEIELNMLMLNQGVNFVEPETWEQVVGHGQNAKVIKAMMTNSLGQGQALFVHTPDAEVPLGSTADYNDLIVVETLIRYSTDRDWILASLAQDRRPEVVKMAKERIKELDEDQKARKQQALAMDFA